MAHYECAACLQFFCICPAFTKTPHKRRKNEPSFQQRCLGIVCLNHRKYRAKSKPRAACEECWRAYIKEQDKITVSIVQCTHPAPSDGVPWTCPDC